MVTIGIDAHKRSHTVVAIDEQGRQLAERVGGTTSADHLALVAWAARFAERRWAVEDCRHLSRRLERDLLAAGERIVRVPPKLMANARDAVRRFGGFRAEKHGGCITQSRARLSVRMAGRP